MYVPFANKHLFQDIRIPYIMYTYYYRNIYPLKTLSRPFLSSLNFNRTAYVYLWDWNQLTPQLNFTEIIISPCIIHCLIYQSFVCSMVYPCSSLYYISQTSVISYYIPIGVRRSLINSQCQRWLGKLTTMTTTTKTTMHNITLKISDTQNFQYGRETASFS